MSFEALGLDPAILENVKRAKYTSPTPIQERAIPLIMSGQDLLGCAQTGTGKTAAFSLPVLHRLLAEGQRTEPQGKSKRGRPIRALVLTPTRELANQVMESFSTYGRGLGIRCAVVYGGVSQKPQVNQ